MQTIFIIIKCSNEEHCLKILDLEINKGIAIIIQACDSVARKRGEKQGGGGGMWKKKRILKCQLHHILKEIQTVLELKWSFFSPQTFNYLYY